MRPTLRFEHRGRTVRCQLRTTASRDQLWDAWADPKKLGHWCADAARGEAEAGSTMTLVFESLRYCVPYDVLVAEPGEYLLMAAHGEAGRPIGMLEIAIAGDGDETLLTVANSGVPDGPEGDDDYESLMSSWHLALEVLGYYVANHFGAPRRTMMLVRPANFDYQDLAPLYRTAGGLTRWLAQDASVAPDGSYQLSLREGDGGGTLTGRVLVTTKREVSLSAEEIDGVLELKAFGSGRGRTAVGVSCSSWSLSDREASALLDTLDPALARLAAALAA